MKASTPPPPNLPSHRVGYAHVSSVGQNLDSQVDALERAGCGKTFSDKMTGSRMDRPGWDQLMDYLRSGDVLVVTELSRMTRSLLHLLETAQLLEKKQVDLISLRENIDTSTATGRCFLSMMGAIHQMERELRAPNAPPPAGLQRERGERPVVAHEPMSPDSRTPKSCTKTPVRRQTKSARLSELDDASSSPTSRSSGTSSQLTLPPIRPFRGVGQK